MISLMRNDGVASSDISYARHPSAPLDHPKHQTRRRQLILATLATSFSSLIQSQPAFAKQRIQLEYCLVSLLRALEILQSIANNLADSNTRPSTSETRIKTYLEARSAAKALLTGKLSSGTITKRVYDLSSLRLVDCLQDLAFYYGSTMSPSPQSTMRLESLMHDWQESIAEMFEFDGLDSLTDPSPRESLTLAQYSDQKAAFVQRCLQEKVLVLGPQILQFYQQTPAMDAAERYVKQYSIGS